MISVPPVLRSATLQGVGAVAGVMLGVVLARRLGPDGSGYVSSYVNIANLFAVVGTLGLPQAFVFFMTGHGLSPRAVARFAAQFVAIIGGAVGAGLVVYVSIAPAGPDWVMIWTLIGGLSLVIVLMARGILLGKSISVSFDLVSISTNILALLVCVAWPWPRSADLVRCIAVAYLVSAAWGAFSALGSVSAPPAESDGRGQVAGADMIAMMKYGFWAWLPQVLGVGTVFVTYRAFGLAEDRDVAVGLFSSALVVYNIVQGPLSLFVPALMRHWSGQRSVEDGLAREYGLASGLGNLLLVSINVVYFFFGKMLITVIFGMAFAGATSAIAWLLLAAIAGYHCRLMSSMLYAHGRPRSVARGYAIRFFVIAIAWPILNVLSLDATQATELMAAAWAIADWASFIDMAISTRRVTSISWREIVGTKLSWSAHTG